MDTRDYILKGLKKAYRTVFKPKFEPDGNRFLDRQEANDKIYQLLISDKPCMISRYGTGEIGVMANYLAVHSNESLLKRCYKYITDNCGLPWWDKLFFESMQNNMGVFPKTTDVLERFAERYLADSPQIDLLGSFNYTEKLMPLRADVQKVHLECLYPFFVERPWTKALRDKKVLVVHPFTETIKAQCARCEKIFENADVLPEFELKTLRAVQSNAGNEVPFSDWFEALKYMEDEIAKIDFDIAIIGCGAYGLPLAATIKRMGKKAVHLGGGSQLLFGIKGKRWDNDGYHNKELPQLNTSYSNLYNEYWVRPSQDETPKSATKVEGACYW